MAQYEEALFRGIFRTAHADHLACAQDEWLNQPCRDRNGDPVERPLVWSRRNGPWRRVPILWVGAAPGNAGGLGASGLGAHGTRIPFGGDIAGGNLDVLLSSIGVTRNDTFIVASLNQLPLRGGGEPTLAELAAPVGGYADSIALLRDTIIAAGPALIVALGNVALRCTAAALTRDDEGPPGVARAASPLRLPTLQRLERAGIRRGEATDWPHVALPAAPGFTGEWARAWQDSRLPRIVQLLHPSAQNMSPFAGRATLFHQRMLDTSAALAKAVRGVPGVPGAAAHQPRPPLPSHGIYALPEWRARVADRHARFDALWREHGV